MTLVGSGGLRFRLTDRPLPVAEAHTTKPFVLAAVRTIDGLDRCQYPHAEVLQTLLVTVEQIGLVIQDGQNAVVVILFSAHGTDRYLKGLDGQPWSEIR